ncbi:hypothetical protein ACFQX7_33440 [Luedemannella flava]
MQHVERGVAVARVELVGDRAGQTRGVGSGGTSGVAGALTGGPDDPADPVGTTRGGSPAEHPATAAMRTSAAAIIRSGGRAASGAIAAFCHSDPNRNRYQT